MLYESTSGRGQVINTNKGRSLHVGPRESVLLQDGEETSPEIVGRLLGKHGRLKKTPEDKEKEKEKVATLSAPESAPVATEVIPVVVPVVREVPAPAAAAAEHSQSPKNKGKKESE